MLFALLPLAPFTLTNMVAGAFHIRFRDYMLGTTIGILPGLLAVTVVGSQLGTLLEAESLEGVIWGVVVIAGALGAIALLRYLASRRGPPNP